MQNTRRSAIYSEKGPIKCRRNPFDLLFVLIMINIIHPKRGAGAFVLFLEMQDFPIWQRLLTFSALLVFQKHARQQHCCGQKFSVGEGDFLHQFKSSSGIVRRIENLTKLLKIPPRRERLMPVSGRNDIDGGHWAVLIDLH